MADFNIRSDSVDVEQIMHNIRARIREKRGVDYTEQQIHEMAKARLERFLDPQGVRSDLLEEFRRARVADEPPLLNYKFEDSTLFESDKAWVRFVRRMLKPVLKLFFNPNPLANALHIQGQLNEQVIRRAEWDSLYYEVMHNLVLETTRLGIEVKNMRMKVESVGSRLDFAERRARAVEGIVQYRAISGVDVPPAAAVPKDGAPAEPAAESAAAAEAPGGTNGARRRRRRRRGRRGGARIPQAAAGTAAPERDEGTDEAGDAGLPDGPDEGFDAPDAGSSDQ
jgi:hypothetical protein